MFLSTSLSLYCTSFRQVPMTMELVFYFEKICSLWELRMENEWVLENFVWFQITSVLMNSYFFVTTSRNKELISWNSRCRNVTQITDHWDSPIIRNCNLEEFFTYIFCLTNFDAWDIPLSSKTQPRWMLGKILRLFWLLVFKMGGDIEVQNVKVRPTDPHERNSLGVKSSIRQFCCLRELSKKFVGEYLELVGRKGKSIFEYLRVSSSAQLFGNKLDPKSFF